MPECDTQVTQRAYQSIVVVVLVVRPLWGHWYVGSGEFSDLIPIDTKMIVLRLHLLDKVLFESLSLKVSLGRRCRYAFSVGEVQSNRQRTTQVDSKIKSAMSKTSMVLYVCEVNLNRPQRRRQVC